MADKATVDKVTPEIERLLPEELEIEWLGSGYGGFNPDGRLRGVAEGPMWVDEGGYLLFDDNANGDRWKWSPTEGISLHHGDTGNANGLARDIQGRLYSACHETRQVTRQELDGSITVVCNNYRGQRFNRPNDIVVRSDGAIYFTDPITLGVKSELDYAGVYRVSPDLGELNCMVWDFALPNGLCFSPDEKILYVNDSQRAHIRSFGIDTMFGSGYLNLGTDRIFHEGMRNPDRPGGPDGMKVDVEGNVWSTGPGGIWVIDPNGKHLGSIILGNGIHATNFAFGGDDMKDIFITTFDKMAVLRKAKIAGLSATPGAGL